ncbi:MAG: hypothetical protein RLZZ175_974 [Bacteroidota bacterium]|jgi:tetratricopeptide (TPR) repeat protein
MNKLKLIKVTIGDNDNDKPYVEFFKQLNDFKIEIFPDSQIFFSKDNNYFETSLSKIEEDAFGVTYLGKLPNGVDFRLFILSEMTKKLYNAKKANQTISFGGISVNSYAVHFEIIELEDEEDINAQLVPFYEQIVESVNNENYKLAYELVEEMHTIIPNNDIVYNISASIKMEAEDYLGCVEDSKKCVSINPNNAEGWSHLGVSYCIIGQIEQGLLALKKAIELGHADSVLNYNYWEKMV